MDEFYLGSLMLAAFPFAPKGWARCDGQLLGVTQNQALFSLIGTTYGGNGQTTFALPDLRGRVPLGVGSSADAADQPDPVVQHGEVGGLETVTLTTAQMPPHVHDLMASGRQGTTSSPQGTLVAAGQVPRFAAATTGATLAPGALSAGGAGQPHENRGPSLTVSWLIALTGAFPSRP